MLYRIFLAIQIFYLALYGLRFSFFSTGEVLGAGTEYYKKEEISYPKISARIQLETETAFDQKEVVEYEAIPFEVSYVDDEDLEYGLEEVITPGVEGTKNLTYLVTHWLDEEIDRVLIATEIEEPVTEVVSLGKKIVWHELDTPDFGTIKYWRKMRVWATKYDSSCPGCSHTTALGAPVQVGVCAVDPTVIAMYTHFYVPGYGRCQALDVGGAIKGEKIDLAFPDASAVPWGSQYVDIYLMDNIPED
jgi:3D (Asp-Asp-Asp) domain-containing protein